ncbi:hypothetical protein SUGI_0292300 [Cryptomeria japonica]|nr:hypothetical protein SUGI_0292300 [Cryptomeria japonica]
MGFHVSLDLKALEADDSIPAELQHAIASATLHIAIFSPNYAQSPRCLAELPFMLKSRAKFIPIFYHVDPSDLRYMPLHFQSMKTSRILLCEKQKKLLADLGVHHLPLDNVDEGKAILVNRLSSHRGLIVLDDVDHIDHLNALLPNKHNLALYSFHYQIIE